MALPEKDLTSLVAVLSNQMGELKHAVDESIRDLRGRVTKLEEHRIRSEERERLRGLHREQLEDLEDKRQALGLSRRQLRWAMVAVVMTMLGVAVSLTIGLIQLVH